VGSGGGGATGVAGRGGAAGGGAGISGRAGAAAAGAAGTGGNAGVGGMAGQANPCANGVRDGAETDVDCGGGGCPKCDANKACASNTDCKTENCSRLFCALVSGPPNWLPGPPLNYGRAYATAGIALGTRQENFLVIGGRDDGGIDTYEELYTGEGWGYYSDQKATTGAAATDAAGDLLIFSGQSVWKLSVPKTLVQLSTVMPTLRSSPGAALGPNGLVYVIGGYPNSGGVTGTVEAYDPVANKWTTGLRPMPTPRQSPAAALGQDGLIYAIGGATYNGDEVEAYDVATNTWTTKSSLPVDGWGTSAVNGPDGRLYATGSRLAAGLVNAFTPAIDRWAPVASLSSSRSGAELVVEPDGHIWAIGGTLNPEAPGETTVEIYGPSVTVNPTQALPGGTIAVRGSNFAANATVTVYLESTTGTALAVGTTDAAGALTSPINVNVPSLPAGYHTLVVRDDRSRYPIKLDLQVN
jgi:hypothetical protein